MALLVMNNESLFKYPPISSHPTASHTDGRVNTTQEGFELRILTIEVRTERPVPKEFFVCSLLLYC